MKKHTLRLLGDSTGTVRLPAESLLEALGALVDGARLATCFLLDGISTPKGAKPAWLEAACALEVTGLRSGAAIVDVEAPVLGDVAGSDRLRQSLFARPPMDFEHLSAVECFADVLSLVLASDRDQIVADRPLLDACVRFARSGRGFEGVELAGLAHRASVVLREADASRMELLRDETPGPRAVRVAGVLDTISVSKTDILLALTNGERIGARFEVHEPMLLESLFGKRVVVSGMAYFGPSGKLLLVDAEYLGAAEPGDEIFDDAPVAQVGQMAVPVVPQDQKSGVNAFFGIWPGDETDEELLAAVRAIR